MEPNMRDLIDDAIANAVDAGYIYVECAGCGADGYWTKPGETIPCPMCGHLITREKRLIDQVREWREMFTDFPDSHIGAIGYQVCERLIDELVYNEDLRYRLGRLLKLANEPIYKTGNPDFDAGCEITDSVYKFAIRREWHDDTTEEI